MAYIFAEVKFFGSNLLFYIYIIVMVVPNELNTSENFAFVYKAGLMNSYWAVWLPGWASAQASGIFLLRIFFMGQPKSLKEAARIDGASNVQLFAHIVLPMTIPIVIYRFLTGFTGAYNSYLWNTLVLQDQAKMSVITLLILKSGVVKDSADKGFGVLYAMYIISGLPLMVVSAISLKFFKGTEFASALKM
jgi:multiple sugar transport system permease protein